MAKRVNNDQALLDLAIAGQRPRRVERRTAAAIREAKAAGVVTAMDDALAATAIELARAVDRAASIKPDPYAVASAARELHNALTSLQMTPASRGAPVRDSLAEFMASLDDDPPA